MPAVDSGATLSRLWQEIQGTLLRDGIQPEGPDGPPARVTDVSLVRTHPAGYSVLFLLSASVAGCSAPLRLYAKVRRGRRYGSFTEDPDADRAERLASMEYDELVRTHRYFSAAGPGLGVVRPVAYQKEHRALFVTEAGGTDLGRMVRMDPESGIRALDLSGQWLRHYHHGVHESANEDRSPASFRRDAATRAGRLESLGVPRGSIEAMLGRFGVVADSIGSAHVPCSVNHGDFKLRHIYAHAGGIEVLDFGNIGVGDCYRDVAALLVEITVLPFGSVGRPREPVERLSEAFLHGYFVGPAPPVLGLYVALASMKKWGRRLLRWSPSGIVPIAQGVLARLGAKQAVDRTFVDRWFLERIDRALAAAAAST